MNKKNVIFFIDGFNLYHSLDNNYYKKYKWLNLFKLSQCFVQKNESIVKIYYFTASANWNPGKVKRHKDYILALEQNPVLSTIYGNFREITRNCSFCGNQYKTYEEKETDVNIAVLSATMIKCSGCICV